MWQGIKNGHTHKLLSEWNAFVSVQLHTPGDPQCSAGEHAQQQQLQKSRKGTSPLPVVAM